MSWTTPPTFTVGEVLTSTAMNQISGDLSVLTSAVGLFNKDGAIAGSAPAIGSPDFLIQAGTFLATASAANFSHNFPTAFPHGLLLCVMSSIGGGGNVDVVVPQTSSSKTALAGQIFRGTGGSAPSPFSGTVTIEYFAIGF